MNSIGIGSASTTDSSATTTRLLDWSTTACSVGAIGLVFVQAIGFEIKSSLYASALLAFLSV